MKELGSRMTEVEVKVAALEASTLTSRDIDPIRSDVADLRADVKSLIASDDANTRNMAKFWELEWPTLMGQLRDMVDSVKEVSRELKEQDRRISDSAKDVSNELKDQDRRIDHLHVTYWRLIAGLTASGLIGGGLSQIVDKVILPIVTK